MADIVAELDRAIAEPFGWHTAIIQRARDEIVALRQAMTHDSAAIATLCNHARNEALEEAAHECDEEAKGSGGEVAFRDGCETCAAAIRLLKEKQQ